MAAIPVILNILKIIGLVLAVAVGYILFLVLLVLFVPVRYKVNVQRTGIEGDDPVDIKGHVSWLLHILHVSLGYPGDHVAIIRVFGFPVAKLPLTEEEKAAKAEKKRLKEAKKEEKERKKRGAGEDSADEDTDEASSPDESAEESTGAYSEHEITEDTGFFSHEGLESESDDSDDSEIDFDEEGFDTGSFEQIEDTDETSDEKKSIFSRISDFINNIRYKISNIGYTIKSNYDKISDNVRYYHKVLTSELFERTYEKCKVRLLKLLKEIMPKKRELNVEVGFEDPYTTGEILAIAGIMYPVFGEHVHIVGNFEEEIIRGKGYFKGRVFVFSLVKLAIFYFTSKDLKHLISLFKKEPINKRNKGHKGKGRRSNGGDQ